MQRSNYQEYNIGTFKLEKFAPDGDTKTADFYYNKPPKEWKIQKTLMKNTETERTWGVVKVEIFKDDEFYMSFIRNYPTLPITYAKQNDQEYLITSADYQCITIINLTKKTIKNYVDTDDIKYGAGFCPMSFDWDEDTLYVEGCIWGCPTETMICREIDLENPTEAFNNAEWEDDDDTYYEEEYDDDEEEE